jgi:hypothetical protein
VAAVTVVVFGGGGRVPRGEPRGTVALTVTGFGLAAALMIAGWPVYGSDLAASEGAGIPVTKLRLPPVCVR